MKRLFLNYFPYSGRTKITYCFYLTIVVFSFLVEWSYAQSIDQSEKVFDKRDQYLSHYKHYTIRDGLSSNDIRKVICDSKGFIWVATDNGLNRFDGHRFKRIGMEGGLRSDDIHFVVEDSHQRLWIRLERDNHFYFDLLDLNTFQVSRAEEVVQNFPDISVGHFEYGNDHIYFRDFPTNQLLYRINMNLEAALFYKIEGDIKINWVFPHPDGSVILVTASKDFFHFQTNFINADGQLAQTFPFFSQPIQFFENGSTELALPKDEKCQLYHIDKAEIIHQRTFPSKFKDLINPGDSKRRFLFRDEQMGNYLMFTNNQVWIFDQEENLIGSPGEVLFKDIPGVYFHQPIFDLQGNLWLCTIKHGLVYFPIQKKVFRTATFTGSDPHAGDRVLPLNASFRQIEDQVWVGRYTLFSYDQKEEQFFRWHLAAPNKLLMSYSDEGNQLYLLMENQEDHSIYIQFWDRNKAAWRSQKVHHAFNKPYFFNRLFVDKQGVCWMSTEIGEVYFQSLNKEKQGPVFKSDNFMSLTSGVFDFEATDEGMWLNTKEELFLFEYEKGITRRYNATADSRVPILNRPREVFSFENGKLWLSSRGYGAGVLDYHEDTFTHFNRQSGISNNITYLIQKDHKGIYWIVDRNGLNRLDLDANQITPIAFDLHTFNTEYNEAAKLAPDGSIIFTSNVNTGAVRFSPNSIINEIDRPLVISELSFLNPQTGQYESDYLQIIHNQSIIMKASQSSFSIDIALLDFQRPDFHQYHYRIKGINEDWIALIDNQLLLAGLPYGHFELNLKATNEYGQSARQQLKLPLIISKPYYLETWFILGILFGGLGIIYALFKFRTQNLVKRKLALEAIVKSRTHQIEQDKQVIEQQAKQLQELDQIKSRFFANVSHELRTPLSLMLGPISSTLSNTNLDTKSRFYLNLAKRNGNRLLQLINEILDLSKLEASKMKVQAQEVLFYAFIKRLTASFESHAQNKNIQFSLKYHLPEALLLFLDVSKMEIVLNNLLSNAFKFTPSGGRVKIWARSQEGNIVISVEDSGRGIAPKDLPYIFDRYYQSEVSDAPTEGGTGIGLALSKELAQLFEGDIQVESVLGKGTTFTFYFPKEEVFRSLTTEEYQALRIDEQEDQPLKKAGEVVPAAGNPEAHKQHSILVVEDNPDLQQYIKTLLQTKYQVMTVGNGAIALEVLTQHPNKLPSLILSDVMMPEMDGYQLLNRLKGSDQFRHIPVIMLTARAALEDKLKALRIGVDDYMLKPFQEVELFARIDNILEKQKWTAQGDIAKNKSGEPIETEQDRPALSNTDNQWLQRLEEEVQKQLANPLMDIQQLASSMGLSTRQFQRKIRQLTHLSPTEYIREARLHEARSLLESGNYETVKAIAISVGIQNFSYFGRIYKKRFGKLPSEYRNPVK